MASEAASHREQTGSAVAEREIVDAQRTGCCVVGGGPAGAVLSLLLARRGVDVVLLEEHGDFDRDFRGDTIHPAIMEIMDEIGLADEVLKLPHTEIRNAAVQTTDGPLATISFERLRTKYPYVTLMPQKDFLEFITSQAQRSPHFRLVMRARVEELIEDDGVVRGVRYRGEDGWHELRAPLTVAADGRFSRVRRLAGFEPIKTSPPIDVLWFRLPRRPEDPLDMLGRVGGGHLLILLNRGEQWQVADAIPKGTYQQLRAGGIEALRATVASAIPELADRVAALQDWKQVSLLSVESNRLRRWYRPGLLLIGDAAHTMSPVGGVGINYAIQDAVVAANVLGDGLKAGRVSERELARVQWAREWPTRAIQAMQAVVQDVVLNEVLQSTGAVRLPWLGRALMRLPGTRTLPARLVGFGLVPVHVRNAAELRLS
jgi:2-polyprenyl-6-methoxyphenol hydroxylase-like FAD-dependent oxidoreductase